VIFEVQTGDTRVALISSWLADRLTQEAAPP
jgi:hypothetical protein